MAKHCEERPSVFMEFRIEGMCEMHEHALAAIINKTFENALSLYGELAEVEIDSVVTGRDEAPLPEAGGTH